MELTHLTGLPIVSKDELDSSVLIVDDIVDSGATRQQFKGFDFACIHIKPHSECESVTFCVYDHVDEWIQYWWEEEEKPAEDAVRRLIEMIGDNPNRQGLLETPARVIKAYDKLFEGYSVRTQDIIKKFDEKYNEMVLLKNIEIYSMCEHHMLPIIGKAHVAYIPSNGKVIGLSKLARITDMYARRLQIQERLGDQITQCLMDELDPVGAACVIEARHLCVQMRGVEKQNSVMVTSSLKGIFLEDSTKGLAARNEFMRLTQN
ncbi:MAG: GTP cyclohydrolase I FolE [Chloroflexi bacterium]|nr:MAG: GTP cyclohydrolase I FolE [Chloroflexota bacterium]